MQIVPEISIIVPVFKAEIWLDECVRSIVNQSFKFFELILVDDGSPDNCPAMCDSYACIDARIKVIHQKNAGLSVARNNGIEYSKAQKIAFIDSDDLMAPNSLAALNCEMDNTGADIVLGAIERFDKKGVRRFYTRFNERKMMSGREALFLILDGKFLNVSLCGGLYRRSLFNSIRMPEHYICEDWYITPELYLKSDLVIFIPTLWYLYRENEDSIMYNLMRKTNCQIIAVAEHCIEIIRKEDEDLYYDTLWPNLRRVWKWVGIIYSDYRQKSEYVFLSSVRKLMKTHLRDLNVKKNMRFFEIVGVYSFCYSEPIYNLMYYLKMNIGRWIRR
jgi:glycosyltransferase involved in cell wall biosynthesis